jgi:hypothetical protein
MVRQEGMVEAGGMVEASSTTTISGTALRLSDQERGQDNQGLSLEILGTRQRYRPCWFLG